MEKGIKNADAIAYKHKPASTRAINNRLEIAGGKKQKKEEMKEKQKAETMAAKVCKGRRKMSSSSKKEDESNTGNNIDLNHANNIYPLQL